MRNIPANEIRF